LEVFVKHPRMDPTHVYMYESLGRDLNPKH
jgi:hypothetical protein